MKDEIDATMIEGVEGLADSLMYLLDHLGWLLLDPLGWGTTYLTDVVCVDATTGDDSKATVGGTGLL